jgi:hypothetical protein
LRKSRNLSHGRERRSISAIDPGLWGFAMNPPEIVFIRKRPFGMKLSAVSFEPSA